MSQDLALAVSLVFDYIGDLWSVPFPGTSIPIGIVLTSGTAILICWKLILNRFFGWSDDN